MTVGLAANPVNAHITVNQMVDGFFSKSVAGASDVPLTDDEATWAIIELTGALTGSINVTVPDIANTFAVINNTTGSYNITVKSVTGTGVLLPQGFSKLLYCDGTNIEYLENPKNREASAPASSSGTLTLDLALGLDFNVILTEAVTTLAFSNVPAGVTSITLDLTQDGTGTWAMTWPASVKWDSAAAPTLTTTAASNAVLEFRTKDGGTTWQGRLYGDDIS